MEDMRSRSGESPEILYRMPDEMRKELSEPLGPVLTDDISLLKGNTVISVGDVCTITLYRRGIMPQLAVLDGKTRRSSILDWKELKYERKVQVKNPQSTISRSLWDAIESSLKSREKTLIIVDGEEDLASLPCILMAPEGSYVVYGIPDKGMCAVKVDEHARRKVKDALSRMKTEA